MLFCSLPPARPLSHVSTASSDRSSPVFTQQAPPPQEEAYVPPDDDPIVLQTTTVVKSVMELSNKVPLSRPTQYVELVKVCPCVCVYVCVCACIKYSLAL